MIRTVISTYTTGVPNNDQIVKILIIIYQATGNALFSSIRYHLSAESSSESLSSVPSILTATI
jgi:hypothetical protein